MITKYYYTWFSDYYNTSPFEKVKLKIAERLEFLVGHIYYKYQSNRDGEVILEIYTYADNESQAVNNINYSNNLLSFLYNIRVENVTSLSTAEVEHEPIFLPVVKGNNLRRLYEVCNTISSLSYKKKKF